MSATHEIESLSTRRNERRWTRSPVEQWGPLLGFNAIFAGGNESGTELVRDPRTPDRTIAPRTGPSHPRTYVSSDRWCYLAFFPVIACSRKADIDTLLAT